MSADLVYLGAYSSSLQEQVRDLLRGDRSALAAVLLRKYPQPHVVRTDKALYQYATEIKNRHLRNADAVNKVVFDSKIHVVRHALGLHTTLSRVQGGRLAAKHEIRIASMFKQVPDEFLRMIVVHELSTIRRSISCASIWSRATTNLNWMYGFTLRISNWLESACGLTQRAEKFWI